MEMSGSHTIPAGRQEVWDALNDPEILKKCIPGCDSLEKISETQMNATVTAKIGPVKAKFKGAVSLENINAPEGYTIVGEGKGGVAGFAKGAADVVLVQEGDMTILSFEARAQVGGKLAQLGSRLVESTAKKMADDFFSTFSKAVAGDNAELESDGENKSAFIDEGTIEEAKHIALEDAEHAVEEKVHDIEEKVEVAAIKSAFGGPVVWGLCLLGVLIIALAVAT